MRGRFRSHAEGLRRFGEFLWGERRSSGQGFERSRTCALLPPELSTCEGHDFVREMPIRGDLPSDKREHPGDSVLAFMIAKDMTTRDRAFGYARLIRERAHAGVGVPDPLAVKVRAEQPASFRKQIRDLLVASARVIRIVLVSDIRRADEHPVPPRHDEKGAPVGACYGVERVTERPHVRDDEMASPRASDQAGDGAREQMADGIHPWAGSVDHQVRADGDLFSADSIPYARAAHGPPSTRISITSA